MNANPVRFRTADAHNMRKAGKLYRRVVPRGSLAQYVRVERNAVRHITDQNDLRDQGLTPLRNYRMSQNAFAFFRGTADLMAFDLAAQSQTGIQVVICGDAHIGNFGLYASPERRIIFDLNDFDEAAPGPWEWDLLRLVTSVILGAKSLGLDGQETRACALAAARSYRTQLDRFCKLPSLDRHFESLDESGLVSAFRDETRDMVDKAVAKARTRTSERAAARMLAPDASGTPRFVEDPPILTKVSRTQAPWIHGLFEQYRDTTTADISLFLSGFTLTDAARRVVGVGSVGTNCYLVNLVGDSGHCLVMQIKEALPSVVSTHSRANVTTPPTLPGGTPDGRRVVDHQRILQAFSDPFLGYFSSEGRDFYVRQFHDSKGSFDPSRMTPVQFMEFGQLCAGMLARSHSQSPWAPFVAGYLGGADTVDRAVVAWSTAYAAQAEADYQEFLAAIDSGAVPVEKG